METPSLSDLATSPHPETLQKYVFFLNIKIYKSHILAKCNIAEVLDITPEHDLPYRACLKSNFLHGPYEDSNDPEDSCFHHTNHGAASITTIQTHEVL